MKLLKSLFLSLAVVFAFSCSQLNLKNPMGSISVSLPGSASRMIVGDEMNVDSFETVTYKVSIYSSSGVLYDEKEGAPGNQIDFGNIPEGPCVVKGFCLAGGDVIAADCKNVSVKAGDVVPVVLALTYNRMGNIDFAKSSIRYSGNVSFSSVEEMDFYIAENFTSNLSADIYFNNGYMERVAYDPDKFEVGDCEKDDAQSVAGKDAYGIYVNWNDSDIGKTINLYVVTSGASNPMDPSVGHSPENPCMNSEELGSAITNSKTGDTIYISGASDGSDGSDGYVFQMTETHTIGINLTIKSAVENLTIKRKAGTYIYVSSGYQLNINESNSDKKIKFTDDGSGNTSNFIMGENGKLVAYNAEFEGVGWGAVLVKEAELHGCSFKEIASKYGAVHVSAYSSALIDSCIFENNTSIEVPSYGDIYLAKGSDDTTLTLSGSVSTDISIYVANSSCDDPKIAVDGIEFSSFKLHIKMESWPEAESITLFVKKSGTFTSAADLDYKYTFVVHPGTVPSSPTIEGLDDYMTSLDGTSKEYMVIKI